MKPWLPLIEKIAKMAESCSRQLRAWADSLQNSDIKGPRHLNDKSRADYGKRRESEAGRKEFAEMEREALLKMPDGHPFKESMRRKGRI